MFEDAGATDTEAELLLLDDDEATAVEAGRTCKDTDRHRTGLQNAGVDVEVPVCERGRNLRMKLLFTDIDADCCV